MSGAYFDDFGHDRELMRERGDLVVGRHVIRTGIDLMNLAMDSAMETQRLIGERDALRVEVTAANARTADHQVTIARTEAELRRMKERAERDGEQLTDAKRELVKLRTGVAELAQMYRQSKEKPDNGVVADDIDGLLLIDEGDDA